MARLEVATRGKSLADITADVDEWLADIDANEGLVTLFVRHTSASLTIQENTDPRVQMDLVTALDRMAPENFNWLHDDEGADDMPAHVKTVVTGVSLPIPVLGGRMDLGMWQAVYLIEHRRRDHTRSLTLHYSGT
ncbi:YjbQ family protein [Rhodobacteraceae bacterium RKSG542]|nr:secondary thiamine-phosphate synthase enzyme YjbQ [Pseudovibrio flavus]MTI18819.1 YjbQ family protein [Pseudovibrio flavus]